MAEATVTPVGWERSMMAAEKVKERLRRATRALEDAGIPYAVAGGNAVAEWVGRVDEEAVRTTRDVDLLVRRADFQRSARLWRGSGLYITNCSTWRCSLTDQTVNRAAACIFCLRAKRSEQTNLIRRRISMSPSQERNSRWRRLMP